jgi:uncharacterized protein
MILLSFVCAFFVGVVLGLFGGGGSILGVPILVYLVGIPASLATVYSLFLVGVSSLVGTVTYFRRGLVDFPMGILFLLPSMIGVWVARRVLLPATPPIVFDGFYPLAKDQLILLVFAVVMVVAAYSMLRPKRSGVTSTAVARPRNSIIALYALFAGLLMGFVGAGGGFLIIPVLVGLGRVEMKKAIGTSLAIITVSSLFGFSSDFFAGVSMDWKFLGLFTGLSVLGVFAGTWASARVPAAQLKQGFGLMVLIIAAGMLVKELVF